LKRISTIVIFVGTIWALVLNVFLLPKLDVDTYHDGFIYPMALQSSNGYIPNRDFFSLYGPVGPTVSGLWIRLFGESLTVLRLYGACLILVIGLFTYLIIQKISNELVAWTLSLVWLIGNPLIVHPSLPWVDLHTTLIVVLSAYVFISRRFDFMDIKMKATTLGLLFGLGIFTKVNFGLVAVAALILLTTHFGVSMAIRFVIGILASTLSVMGYLAINNSLIPYFEQTIYFAWIQHDEGKQLRGILNVKSIVFGCILLLLCHLLIRYRNKISWLNKPAIKFALLTTLCVFWVYVAAQFRRINEPFSALELDPQKAIENVLKNAPYFPLYASIFVLPALYLATISKKSHRNNRKNRQNVLFVGIICLAYPLQLYPNPEPGHIWYVFPVAIIGITAFASLQAHEVVLQSTIKFFVAPTICALVIINFQFLNVTRVKHSIEPLVGMMSTPKVVSSIDGTLNLLTLYVSKAPVRFNCPRGVYSVFSNKYLASDYQYVDIIPGFYKEKRKAPLTFECDLQPEEISEIESKFDVVFRSKSEIEGLNNILYRTP